MGQDGDTLYVAMEYVPGTTVADWSRIQVRSLTDVIGLLLKISEALDYAHHLGVVHRDIKPTNILVTEGGQPKVTDFGLAKLSGGSASASSRIVGTPRYMSPEQIRGGQLDGRSDQFSLAIMAYELLTGRLPFPSGNLQTLMYHILMQEPAPAHHANPHLPASVSRPLARALSKDPALRFPSCVQFVREIETALQQPLAHTVSGPAFTPSFRPPPNRRRALWVAGSCAAAVLLFGAAPLVIYLMQPKPPERVETTTPPPRTRTEKAAGAEPAQPQKTAEINPQQKTVKTEPRGDPELRRALYDAIKSDRPAPSSRI